MSDVVIGVIKGHSWPQVEHYAISLCRSGFSGTKLMLVNNVPTEIRRMLALLKFDVVDCPKAPHALGDPADRFYYASEWLKNNPKRFAVWTDIRDVVFQSNPIAWIEKNIGPDKLIIGSENILVKDQELHKRWAHDTYGPTIAVEMGETIALNAGTFVGDGVAVQQLFAAIYEGCYQVRHTGTGNSGLLARDQIVMNRILRQSPFKEIMRAPRQDEGFAAICGLVGQPAKYAAWLTDVAPLLSNGVLTNAKGMVFPIIHQYDRNPVWKAAMLSKYKGTPAELQGR